MARENPTWGRRRIRAELALLGYDGRRADRRQVHAPDVASALARRGGPFLPRMPETSSPSTSSSSRPSPSACSSSSSCLRHDRRELLHVNVTDHPTAVWTARQIIEAFPEETAPKYLLRDRDAIYGEVLHPVRRHDGDPRGDHRPQSALAEPVRGAGDRLHPPRVPGSRPHPERGPSPPALARLLAYYNTARPHQSLDNNSPQPPRHRPPARWADRRHSAGRRAPSPLPARRLITATATHSSPASTVASAAGSPCGPQYSSRLRPWTIEPSRGATATLADEVSNRDRGRRHPQSRGAPGRAPRSPGTRPPSRRPWG